MNTRPIINLIPYHQNGETVFMEYPSLGILPGEIDSCSKWITWHKELKQKFGKAEANRMVVEEIENRGFFSHVHGCKFNCEWATYFKSQGIDPGFVSNVLCPVGEVIEEVAEGSSALATGANKTANALKSTVPLLALGLIGGVGYYVYKNYIKGNKTLKIGGVKLG